MGILEGWVQRQASSGQKGHLAPKSDLDCKLGLTVA